jgi:hypothetical protein
MKEEVVAWSECYPGSRLAELKKTTRNLGEDSRSLNRDSNLESPEYEVKMLNI